MSPIRTSAFPPPVNAHRRTSAILALTLLGVACSGDDGAQGPPGPPGGNTPTLTRSSALPGFNLQIVDVDGGSGPNGNFRAGDRIAVTFTATEGAQGSNPPGDPIPSANWAFQEALFAGPANNYQLMLSTRDIADNATQNADGSWTFTWPDPIPVTVPDQINQANTIPYDSGTLAGQPLPDGTYTIGISMRQNIEIEGTTFRDATSTTIDVLFGSATQIDHPELVTDANCQSCHTTLRAHGDNRYGVAMCVLCHTNGAEDLNDPNAVAGETLGLSISFQTMIHKIHSGRHLPSVNGKSVDGAGDPVYGSPTPYVIVRSRGEFDFSHVAFPQWPHLSQGMPRDVGYDALAGNEQDIEDAILGGPTNCAACHGDPDGTGPQQPPADGDAIFSNTIVTRACIACHDDWDPSKPYTANGRTMPASLDDTTCTACHGEAPTNPNAAINVRKAHTHPLLDTSPTPLWGAGAGARGLQFNVTAINEVNGDGDGLIEVGEGIEVAVDLVDGQGARVDPAALERVEIIATGPVENPNSLYFTGFNSNPSRAPSPTSILTGAGSSHTFILPERVPLEEATPVSATVFNTARTPHYDTRFGTHGQTLVWTVPTGVSSGVFLTADVAPHQNYLDVTDGSGFAAGDIIVIDEATASREYVEVLAVQDDRLWFAAPIDVVGSVPRNQHLASASVEVVAVTATAETGFTLDEATGTITFGAAPSGRVLVTYTTDFAVPQRYRGAINNSPSTDPNAPALDATIGEWTGMDLVDGTYRLGIYGEVSFDVTVSGGGNSQITSYTEGAEGNTVAAFRLGSSGPLEANTRIESAASCYACHRDLQFHGAHRRGYDNCTLCHGVAGAEDWPIYKTSGLSSLPTPGVTIEFRGMIHKIHHGLDLAAGANYQVIGFRGNPHSYEHVGFPSFKGGTANCEACHGTGNTAWHAPTLRLHPDEASTAPHLEWRMVCGSCHDGRTALAHMAANSALGLESCAICHGDGNDLSVETAHNHHRR